MSDQGITPVVYPTLNGNGYAKDIPTLCDEVFSSLILARHRQSEIYYGNALSWDYIMRQFANEPLQLAEATETLFKDAYSRLFTNVAVSATIEEATDGSTMDRIVLEITATLNNTNFSVGHQIYSLDGTVKKLVRTLNGQENITEL
jgi:hypothetical protein